MNIILLIIVGFFSGVIGSHIFGSLGHDIGFVLGLVIFIVTYCCLSYGD